MDIEALRLLFALLRSAVCGEALTECEKGLYSAERVRLVASLAKKHDVLHLIALALKNEGLTSCASGSSDSENAAVEEGEKLSKLNKKLENEIMTAVYRHETQAFALGEISSALEGANVPFIPLKGSVLRGYYPEPWMRTSCDIDILVKEEDLPAATAAITEGLGYECQYTGSHDVSISAPGGQHIELHYTLMGDTCIKTANSVLNDVWQIAKKCENGEYRYEMPAEFFYFYHIAHMAKHFENGGCGIRPFIDLWILNHRVKIDGEKRRALLEQGGLLEFACQAEHLSEVWLSGAEHTEITAKAEKFILRGGVYGVNESRILVQQQKRGGKLKYMLSRVFIPYDNIKYLYPILQKHKWLTPIMEVRRWFKLVFCGKFKRSMGELRYNSRVSAEEAENMRTFLNDMGL